MFFYNERRQLGEVELSELKQAARWAAKGIGGSNSMSFFVDLYTHRKALAELGVVFSLDELELYEVEAFAVINSAIAKQQNDAQKQAAHKARGKRKGRR